MTRPLVFGLRLALWYAALFVIGCISIVFLTYYLTAISIEQRDREIIRGKLGDYAAAYARGGVRVLTATVRAEQAVAPERLFVRVLGPNVDAVVLGSPEGWDPSKLEVESARLDDGTLIQVGKSTEPRDDLLARFRAVLGLVTLLIVFVALSGGWMVTQSALTPIRRLIRAVRRIIRTGRTDARVPLAGAVATVDDERPTDAIVELTVLFNAMLDKIEGLVSAMHGALDNVSHDLRTPLTRLRGAAELALAGQPDIDRYREALADCVEETDRVLVMLDTLMDISEAESGAMQLKREAIPLTDVARRAIELYKEVAEAKGTGLELTAAQQPPVLEVLGDRSRLEQVAANLIDNAVKYTGPGGRVDVTVRTEDGYAVFEVGDTGPGIPADELPRIWDRLFRGDRSRTERGLGLGLSLVKAIVEAHGGTVAVSTEVGHGSTFTVRLNLSSL